MRVLYVIDSLVSGGAERSLVSMAPHLMELGVDLRVLLLHDRAGLEGQLGIVPWERTHAMGRIGWAQAVTSTCRRQRPALVHTTLFDADVAGRIGAALAGVPSVTSVVNPAYGPEQLANPAISPARLRGAHLADAVTARMARRIHCNAEHVAAVMTRRLRLRPQRVEVIPRGRDPDHLGKPSPGRRLAARTALGLDDSHTVVLGIARHEFQKGLDVLVEAIGRLAPGSPSLRLLVAGREGNQTRALERMIGDAGLDGVARLLGARDDVADLLCAADVYVLCSRWEGFPGTVLEAMAMATPMVVTAIPGVDEVLGADHPWPAVPVGDPVALADAIATVTGSTGRLAAGKAARRRFLDRFQVSEIAKEMVGFYERALA